MCHRERVPYVVAELVFFCFLFAFLVLHRVLYQLRLLIRLFFFHVVRLCNSHREPLHLLFRLLIQQPHSIGHRQLLHFCDALGVLFGYRVGVVKSHALQLSHDFPVEDRNGVPVELCVARHVPLSAAHGIDKPLPNRHRLQLGVVCGNSVEQPLAVFFKHPLPNEYQLRHRLGNLFRVGVPFLNLFAHREWVRVVMPHLLVVAVAICDELRFAQRHLYGFADEHGVSVRLVNLHWSTLPVWLFHAHPLRHGIWKPVLHRDFVAVCVGERHAVLHRVLVTIEHALGVHLFHLLWNNLLVRLDDALPLRHRIRMSVRDRLSVALCIRKCLAVHNGELIAIKHALGVRLFHLLWDNLPVLFHLAHSLRHVFCMPVLKRHSVALRVGKLYAMHNRDPVTIKHAFGERLFHLLWVVVPIHLNVAHPLRHIFCESVLLRDSIAVCLGKRDPVHHRELIAV